MNLESLRSLQKRIREAKGADRELDWIIANTFKVYRDVFAMGASVITHLDAPNFTLDPDGLGPCVGLMREVLPGWQWTVSESTLETKGGRFFSFVHVPIGYDAPGPWPEGFCHHSNPCLSLLYSIISALIAQEEEAKHTEKAG